MLAVTFDGTAIEDAVDASGLAYWDHERPVTLVWLALDRGSGKRALVSASDTSAEKSRIDADAARLGLPLVWPDAGDDLVRAMQQAWSGDHAALRDAARRYGADGVLIGRARQAAGGGYQVDWSFASPGADGVAAGELEAGPALAAQRYAGVYASRGAAQRTEQIVTVTGIASLEAYAATTRMLARLAPGDLLVLYTDGITETANPEGEEFGRDRLAGILRESRHLPLAEIRQQVDRALCSFAFNAPAADDRTLLLIRPR